MQNSRATACLEIDIFWNIMVKLGLKNQSMDKHEPYLDK